MNSVVWRRRYRRTIFCHKKSDVLHYFALLYSIYEHIQTRRAACFVPFRGEVKLKLEKTTRRYKMRTGEGFGDGKQQQREELLPTVFQVDTVLGPGVDTSEVRRTIPNAASRLRCILRRRLHASLSHDTLKYTALPAGLRIFWRGIQPSMCGKVPFS